VLEFIAGRIAGEDLQDQVLHLCDAPRSERVYSTRRVLAYGLITSVNLANVIRVYV
jgi:hypothetical protein